MTNAWHQGSLVCWRPDGSEQIASPVCCSARTGMFQPWIPLTITKPGHFRSSQAHVKHELARNVVRTCSYPPAKRRGLLENLSCIYICIEDSLLPCCLPKGKLLLQMHQNMPSRCPELAIHSPSQDIRTGARSERRSVELRTGRGWWHRPALGAAPDRRKASS